MMTKRLIAPLIAGALVLAGCETEQTETAAGTVEDTTAVATDVGFVGDDEADVVGANPGELSPINRSGVRGTARVERDGDELRVFVEAEGLEPVAEYNVYVHEGGCTEAGPVVLDAGMLTGGEDGRGSLEFRGGAADVLDAGEVSVQLTASDGEAAACAEAAAE